jgi:DNA polymerase III delta subunit
LGPKAKLGRAQILEQFSLAGEQPIWVLFDAIVRHEGPKAFDILRRVIRQGDEPLAVLFAIVSQVRYLIRAKSLLEREPMDESQLARALGVSAGRAAVLRRQAARLTWEWLLATHRLLAAADYDLKGGEEGAVLPPEVVLERVVAGALSAD